MRKIKEISTNLKLLLDVFGEWDFILRRGGDCYILETSFENQNGQMIHIFFIISEEGACLGVIGDNCRFTFEQLSEKADDAQFDFLVAIEELNESMFLLRTQIDWEVLNEYLLITVMWMQQMVAVMMDIEYKKA